jgi:DNA processing protein
VAEDIKYWVGFNRIAGVGRVRLGLLESYFGSLGDAWGADKAELGRAGLDERTVRAIISGREKVSPDAEMARLARSGITALTCREEAYPARLKEIYDYPPLLYVRGSLLPEDEWSLAVVGTRGATPYGRQVTEEVVADLVRSRITIVSGLARGIDSVAHRAALEAGGRTIAVFGCGLDMVYPAENTDLARRVVENGALVSEYPPGVRPRAEYFPRRNRIMSGMSLGVLVIEAGISSGAMITAQLAMEQNREVMAVPGSILSPVSAGTNRLIQDGAKAVLSYRDALEELNLTAAVAPAAETPEVLPVSDAELTLLGQLGTEPVHIDEVCRASGLPMAQVSSTLAIMELKGMVRQVGMMSYVVAREVREYYQTVID